MSSQFRNVLIFTKIEMSAFHVIALILNTGEVFPLISLSFRLACLPVGMVRSLSLKKDAGQASMTDRRTEKGSPIYSLYLFFILLLHFFWRKER